VGEGLEARQISKIFESGDGISGINLSIEPGEIHALVGLNGAGKSTLMRVMLGMLQPDEGSVLIGGTPLAQLGEAHLARIGHLIEYPLAYSELTVRQNLFLSARLHGLGKSAAAERVDEILDALKLRKFESRVTGKLSLGNRQRVGLASALQHNPDIIILDEPTNALDPSGVILLRSALVDRARSGAATLVSSHHLDEVARIATRITVINNGRTIGALDAGAHDIERTFFNLVHQDDELAA
jgi:ABC-2 type transport system ATP-binding protein